MLLLDTNVVSELRKAKSGRADPKVVYWGKSISERETHISAVTILEIEAGILKLERSGDPFSARLREWLESTILVGFSERILSIDATVAQRSARTHIPNTRPTHDALIAATALVHDLTLVTRNTKDFGGLGLRLINPWTI